MDLVHQPGGDRIGAGGTAHGDVPLAAAFIPGTLGLEVPLDRVLVVEAASSVLEYTTLSAACQISANSRVPGDWAAAAGSESQTSSARTAGPVQVRAHRPLQVVDEGVVLLVWCRARSSLPSSSAM